MIGAGKSGGIGETAGFALAKACKVHRASVGAALQEVGLHVGQEMVLLELWEEDGLKGGELVERLGVEPPTISRMLGRMETRGLLERRRDPEDARSFRVYLTEGGRDLRGPVEDLWRRIEDRAFGGMSEEEKTLFKGLLSRVRENLGAV
ncbi:MAG: MarR family transcriptional regulator [Actinomycetota bacterium]|nr:MarR family transcriptional regulator [Actinomycetota bacterium]